MAVFLLICIIVFNLFYIVYFFRNDRTGKKGRKLIIISSMVFSASAVLIIIESLLNHYWINWYWKKKEKGEQLLEKILEEKPEFHIPGKYVYNHTESYCIETKKGQLPRLIECDDNGSED